jgi:hypothetical protein
MKRLLELADQFWPEWFNIYWAWWAMTLGSITVLISIAEAIRHFVYGQPIVNAKTGDAMTTRQFLTWLVLFGGGGAAFALLGVLSYR